MSSTEKLGFIGLGVMGEPMCRNMAVKSGKPMLAYDRLAAPLERLAAHGVAAAPDVPTLAREADILFLSLPSGAHVETVCKDILPLARKGQVIVDLGTSPVTLTRQLADTFAARGATFVDAPVARTREAAEQGRLSIMVGADAVTAARIRPLLDCCATDVTLCGGVGAGQVAKILNNMVLFETVVAISEAMAIARRFDVDPATIAEALSKGSADSFALRNHGMKAVLPGTFPEQAFSTAYALKDLTYALDMAREAGLDLAGAENARRLMNEAIAKGDGDKYWPVLARVIDAR